jgi:shikimate kinase
LNKQVIDIDEVISIKAGMKIAQIVSQYGWPYFREQERKAVEDIADTDDSIISTGGGIVLQKQNVDVLKKNGTLFWLHANPRTLIERTSDFSNRPALTKHSTVDAEIKEVTKQRDRLYRDSADHIITINSLGIQQVAELIIKAYKEDRR